jgi:hypothetical protein
MTSCFAVAVGLLMLARGASALLMSVAGNAPQSAANYARWPGLVEVVNQPTRQQLVWCNGNEWLGYRGDTAALNATLASFAKVDSPAHRVVLRPGPAHNGYDWMLHISEGISRARVEREELQPVHDLHPYLEVYVSDRLELLALERPAPLKIEQLSDVRTRLAQALVSENAALRDAAERAIASYDRDPLREELGAAEYDEQLRRIQICVKKWSAED